MEQRFLLELDGRLAGRLFDFKPGGTPAVIASGGITQKHLPAAQFPETVLACGTGMSLSFYRWIGSVFRQSDLRSSGAVITLDRRSDLPATRFDFYAALITSVAFPALDASSKNPAYMTLTMKAQRTSSGNPIQTLNLGVHTSAVPKTWAINDFRLRIHGLETECQHVTKIESLRLLQGTVANANPAAREIELEPSSQEFSDLVLEIPRVFSEGFSKWHESMVRKGSYSADSEKNGTLDFLAPGAGGPYFRLQLKGLVPKSISRSGAGSVRVEMLCEGMDFSAGGASVK